MLQKWKQLTTKKRCALLGAVAAVLLLAVYAWAASRPGYWVGEFFLQETETGWQGRVYGEELTVERTQLSDGAKLILRCPSGEAAYEISGTLGYGNQVSASRNGHEIFVGSCHEGFLFDEAGEIFWDSRYSVVGGVGTFILGSENNERPATGLDLRLSQIIQLALEPKRETRGHLWVVLVAALLLSIVFVELWSPELVFRHTVGRYIEGEAEPSDLYEAQRVIGMIVAIGAAIMILLMGFQP